MWPINKRKLWPFQTLSNRSHLALMLLASIAIWLFWIYRSKLLVINTATENSALFLVAGNSVGCANEVTIVDGTLSCHNIQINGQHSLPAARKKLEGDAAGVFLAGAETHKDHFSDSLLRLAKDGTVKCHSVSAKKIYFNIAHPLVTTDTKCVIEGPKDGTAADDYMVHVPGRKIVPLSQTDETPHTLVTYDDAYSIDKYNMPLITSNGVAGKNVLSVSKEIVEADLPNSGPRLLYVSVAGELTSLPLPPSTDKHLLRSTPTEELEWHRPSPGSWYSIQGQPRAGDIMYFDGGSNVSFRRITNPVTTGNVVVQDPEMTLDDSTKLPPLVQFDGKLGRLKRVITRDRVDDSSTVDGIFRSSSTQLHSLTKISWVNEQTDVFKDVVLPQSAQPKSTVAWILLAENKLRGDLLQSPARPLEKIFLASSVDGKYKWLPSNEFVVSFEPGVYDAQTQKFHEVGEPTAKGEAMRKKDLESCVNNANGQWEMSDAKAINDVAEGEDDNDAVNLKQCRSLFGMRREDDHFDAKSVPVSDVGQFAQRTDQLAEHVALSKIEADHRLRMFKSWICLEFACKTSEKFSVLHRRLRLLSHPSTNDGGFVVPFHHMTIEYACLCTNVAGVQVSINHGQNERILQKHSAVPFCKFFKLGHVLQFMSVISSHLLVESGGPEGIERHFLLALFIRNGFNFHKVL